MDFNSIADKLNKMNEKNRLGYVEAKVKKILRTENTESIEEVATMVGCECSGAMCNYCQQDDFGYCGLRGQKIDENKIRMEYCFPAYLKYAEKNR